MNHNIKLQSPSPARSVHVDKAVAFVRRRAARETGSGKLQLHGNMKTTPSWQGIHLRGKRLLGGRSGWVSGGVSSEIKKIIFCYTGLKSQNILEDVGEGGGTLPTSQEDRVKLQKTVLKIIVFTHFIGAFCLLLNVTTSLNINIKKGKQTNCC